MSRVDVDAVWQRLKAAQASRSSGGGPTAACGAGQTGASANCSRATGSMQQHISGSTQPRDQCKEAACEPACGDGEDSIDTLIKALQHDDAATRRATTRKIEALLGQRQAPPATACSSGGDAAAPSKLQPLIQPLALVLVGDKSEACRQAAGEALSLALEQEPAGSIQGEAAARLWAALAGRASGGTDGGQERSEAVRGALWCAIAAALLPLGRWLAATPPALHLLHQAVAAGVDDPCPEVVLAVCDALRRAAAAVGDGLRRVAKEVVATVAPLVSHPRFKVRVAAIAAVGDLLPLGAHEALLPLTGFRDPHMVPIKAFYGDPDLRVNFFGRLAADPQPQVRAAFLALLERCLARLPERRDHDSRLLPYLLSALADDSGCASGGGGGGGGGGPAGAAAANTGGCTSSSGRGSSSNNGKGGACGASASAAAFEAMERVGRVYEVDRGDEVEAMRVYLPPEWQGAGEQLPAGLLERVYGAPASPSDAAAGGDESDASAPPSSRADVHSAPWHALPCSVLRRPRLGARLLVQAAPGGGIAAALAAELCGWQAGVARRSAALLRVWCTYMEAAAGFHLHELLPAMCKALASATAGNDISAAAATAAAATATAAARERRAAARNLEAAARILGAFTPLPYSLEVLLPLAMGLDDGPLSAGSCRPHDSCCDAIDGSSSGGPAAVAAVALLAAVLDGAALRGDVTLSEAWDALLPLTSAWGDHNSSTGSVEDVGLDSSGCGGWGWGMPALVGASTRADAARHAMLRLAASGAELLCAAGCPSTATAATAAGSDASKKNSSSSSNRSSRDGGGRGLPAPRPASGRSRASSSSGSWEDVDVDVAGGDSACHERGSVSEDGNSSTVELLADDHEAAVEEGEEEEGKEGSDDEARRLALLRCVLCLRDAWPQEADRALRNLARSHGLPSPGMLLADNALALLRTADFGPGRCPIAELTLLRALVPGLRQAAEANPSAAAAELAVKLDEVAEATRTCAAWRWPSSSGSGSAAAAATAHALAEWLSALVADGGEDGPDGAPRTLSPLLPLLVGSGCSANGIDGGASDSLDALQVLLCAVLRTCLSGGKGGDGDGNGGDGSDSSGRAAVPKIADIPTVMLALGVVQQLGDAAAAAAEAAAADGDGVAQMVAGAGPSLAACAAAYTWATPTGLCGSSSMEQQQHQERTAAIDDATPSQRSCSASPPPVVPRHTTWSRRWMGAALRAVLQRVAQAGAENSGRGRAAAPVAARAAEALLQASGC